MERYEKYKTSGIEWIGDIPEHWEVRKLKYIAESNPSNIDKKSKDEEAEIFLCNYVDIYKNEFIKSGMNFMKATASKEQIKKFILQKGDVILTKDSESANDIGIPAFITETFDDVVCGYHLTHIKPKRIKGEYLFRQFQCKFQQSYFEVSANGVTRYGLGTDKFNSALIVVPSSTEQILIAAYLDRKTAEIDQIIANKRKLIALYEEEKQAVINQAVTRGVNPNVRLKPSGVEWLGDMPEHWEVKKLKHLLFSFTGGGTPSTANPLYWGGDIPWVSAKDMKQDFIVISEDYITELAIKESSTHYIEDESIIIVVRSGILKHTFPVAINKVPICINQDLKAIKPIKTISNEFMFWKLKGLSNEILTYCNKMGATVDSIEMPDLLDLMFAFPKIEEQQIIVLHIEKESNRLDTIIKKCKKQIELLKEYRTTLISEVVTGKVKVSN